MAEDGRGIYSYHSESEDDDNSTTTIDQEELPKKTSTNESSISRGLFQRFQYSRLRSPSRKGKEFFQRVKTNTNIDNISLPLVKKDLQPGQEWIKGVMLCIWGTALILALNVIMTVIAIGIGYSRKSDNKQFTHTELYDGKCSVTSTWSTGMHLVINVLSSALLAASNYVMQCLSAPSRADVDKAHSKRDQLDIGVFSLRNLWVMDARRKILWGLLFVSSFPVHMLFNTAIFSSISTTEYGVVVIPSDLGEQESLVKADYEARAFYDQIGTTADDILAERFNGTFKKMSVFDCIRDRNVSYNTHAGTVLLVTERGGLHGSSSLVPLDAIIYGNFTTRYWDDDEKAWMNSLDQSSHTKAVHWNYPSWVFKSDGTDTWRTPQNLTSYNAEDTILMWQDSRTLTAFLMTTNPNTNEMESFLHSASNWENSSWASHLEYRIESPSMNYTMASYRGLALLVESHMANISISDCWSKEVDQHCRFYFSLPICLAVILCNIMKLCCMFMAARTDQKQIFLTVGDALSSFLETPDATTKGHCLMSRKETARESRPWLGSILTFSRMTSRSYPKRKRWLTAASWKRWVITYILFLLCLAVSLFLQAMAGVFPWGGSALSYARELGMGKPNGNNIIVPGKDILTLALLANSPQLAFSALYLLCNGLFTCMLAVAEYNDFAIQRKSLRVSWPKGEQRSTYYLSLPYRYSIPLIAVSIVMHWLISQCIFLVKITAYDRYGKPIEGDNIHMNGSITACGYSPLAMFITVIVGIAAMIILVGFSFRRLSSNMPLVSYCSTGISAACHPPQGDEKAYLEPVMWGEVQHESEGNLGPDEISAEEQLTNYPYCTFTSKEVTTPSVVG